MLKLPIRINFSKNIYFLISYLIKRTRFSNQTKILKFTTDFTFDDDVVDYYYYLEE